ncbi:TetR family transcriptional regulator [Georgenia alba]|uniref:TetR family transcriptional regulator n=1 Tax=Georgenia alba TaxID=2233858 RepID=A0ABW2QI94_9MICO
MPRKKTISDEDLLDAVLLVVRQGGPEAVTFQAVAPRAGLAASTVVQRFGTKAALLRAALSQAWDRLDADTDAADGEAPHGPAGVIDLLVRLSAQYDPVDYPDQLLLLREDLRDPVLRERGRRWLDALGAAIERRLAAQAGDAAGLGELTIAHWQGALTVWAFRRHGTPQDAVRRALEDLFRRLDLTASGR